MPKTKKNKVKSKTELEMIFPQSAMTSEEEKELSAYFLQKKSARTQTQSTETPILETKKQL